jgi:phage terminase large subunit-like protein
MNSQPSNTFFSDVALQYCDDVLSNKIPACKQIHQAIQRHCDDLNKIADPSYKYTYDVAKAERVCKFVSKLPHVSGRWASLKNNRFKLEPWQCFLLTCIFGWVEKETGFRRFREAYLCVSRKNGKSFLASGICLYCLLCDSEPGAQVFAAANNLEQAMTVYRPSRQMIDQLPTLRDHFEIEANAKSIITPDGSRFVPLVGVARDGQSAHCCVLDEYHEAKEDSLYLSLTQSMGARTQPLMIVATTAGSTIEGPCHSLQKECEAMLDGTLDRPELFALIYTINKETDWTTDEALTMANPNLGVSVNLEALRTERNNAVRNAAKQNAFKTKKLNIWCNATTAFFNMAHWMDGADAKLKSEDFAGKACWMSADLSSKLDFTCVLKVFKDGNTLYAFPKLYLPEERALDPALGMYSKWVALDALTATAGNVIDIDQIIDETVADIEKFKPSAFVFDKWHADLFVNTIGKRCSGLVMAEIPMETRYLSPAMFEIEALIASKRIKHNNNPVANFCMSNVVAKIDANNNVFPRKARNENKIDFATCLILAMTRIVRQAKTRGTSQIVFG